MSAASLINQFVLDLATASFAVEIWYSSLFIMRPQFRFVFVVFYFTAVLIFTVYLRSANNRIFYKLYAHEAEQRWLIQELTHKQLQVEDLINPAAVSQRLGGP